MISEVVNSMKDLIDYIARKSTTQVKFFSRVSYELEPGSVGQTTDFKDANKRLEWSLKKIVGGAEHTLREKLTISQESHGNLTKEAGPVTMNFTIPMFNAFKLQVKYLQFATKSKTYNPYPWELSFQWPIPIIFDKHQEHKAIWTKMSCYGPSVENYELVDA